MYRWSILCEVGKKRLVCQTYVLASPPWAWRAWALALREERFCTDKENNWSNWLFLRLTVFIWSVFLHPLFSEHSYSYKICLSLNTRNSPPLPSLPHHKFGMKASRGVAHHCHCWRRGAPVRRAQCSLSAACPFFFQKQPACMPTCTVRTTAVPYCRCDANKKLTKSIIGQFRTQM